jgi:hypothetical protein
VKKDDLLNKILERYETASQFRSEFEEKWKRYYRLYRSKSPAKDDMTKANLFIPEVFTTIETIMPRLVSGYLATSKPPVDLVGREIKDHQNAEATKALITYQYENLDFPIFLNDYVKPALLYGTSIAKVYWKHDPRSYDGPMLEVVDIFDFFIDPEARSIDDARFVIHRKMISMEELKERQKLGIYKNVDRIKHGEGTDQNRNPALDRDEVTARIEDIRDVELLEYWENDRVVVVANRDVILRDSANPFSHGKKPFVDINFITVPHEFYGIGIIEPLEGLQNELNTKRNQRLDNVNLIINRMWMMQSGAIDDIRQLRSRPGGVIVTNDINGLKPLPVDDVTTSSYNEEERVVRDIHNTSGINEFVRGNQVMGGNITATEVKIKSEQATTRLDYNLKMMSEKGIRKITQMVIQLNQQFIDMPKVIRIVGAEGVEYRKISLYEISGNFDVKVNPDPAGIGEEERLEKATTALQLLQNVKGANPAPLVRDILEKLGINEQIISEVFKAVEEQKEMATPSRKSGEPIDAPAAGGVPGTAVVSPEGLQGEGIIPEAAQLLMQSGLMDELVDEPM